VAVVVLSLLFGKSKKAQRMGRVMNWVSVALALLLAASACKRAQPTGADADIPLQGLEWPSPSDTPPAGMACNDMTAAQCLLATGCVLEAVPHGDPEYVCREAKGPCEGGVSQFPPLIFKADCEARHGCRYLEAECFCPNAQTRVRSTPSVVMDCVCNDGPPQRCAAASSVPDPD